MLLLFGTRASVAVIAMVAFVCRYCGQDVAQRVTKRTTRFTLFFIPLFSVGSRYENTCSNCGGVTDLTREQAENAQAWAAAH